ncbi:hypothetical protein TNCV_4080261 [Trichonephila clavipes]|nr:hypothetical protein TNCV_4080261 [Trichonephila clavipes]
MDHNRRRQCQAVVACPAVKKNPEGPELAKSGRQHNRQVAKFIPKVTNLVTKNDANLPLPPRFRQVIESPL